MKKRERERERIRIRKKKENKRNRTAPPTSFLFLGSLTWWGDDVMFCATYRPLCFSSFVYFLLVMYTQLNIFHDLSNLKTIRKWTNCRPVPSSAEPKHRRRPTTYWYCRINELTTLPVAVNTWRYIYIYITFWFKIILRTELNLT